MKTYSIIFLLLITSSCQVKRSFLIATFANKNVYKTKSNLVINKIYRNGRPTTDLRQFTIIPNSPVPVITQTATTITSAPGSAASATTPASPSTTDTTTVISTIPADSTITTVVSTPLSSTITSTTTKTRTILSVPPPLATNNFIRYKVISEDGDLKYIRILPGCIFSTTSPNTDIITPAVPTIATEHPEDYIFQVSKKNLIPNTHYLASSALIGKIITIPLKVRNEYWNNDNKILEGSLSLGYGFGWKYKIGNNPYHSHYFSTILYAAGVSQQKYFFLAEDHNGKDSISSKTDQVAVTYWAFGIAYEYEKFNIGIFAGKDKMFGTLKNWTYQDKWWWGIGIGYELFK